MKFKLFKNDSKNMKSANNLDINKYDLRKIKFNRLVRK